MTKVIDLQAYQTKSVEQRGFQPWNKRFGTSHGAKTKVADLSDETLYFLARPGEESAFAFYELIMGILGLGAAPKFYYLPNKDQMMVVDIHFFLADQVRFEMMHRLGWLTNLPSRKYTLLEMVRDFEKIKMECKEKPPRLSEADSDFEAYSKLTSGDKEVFVRKRLRDALEAFRGRLAT